MEFPHLARYFAAVLAGAGVSLAGPVASAQAYPSKPVETVIASPAGGFLKQFADTVADIFQKENLLAQPLQVALHSGRRGAAGFSHVVNQRGDPHTVLVVFTRRFLVNAARTKGGRGLADYTPLALFDSSPQAIIVSAESKIASFKDLLEAARSEPGSISCATVQVLSEGLELYLIERETRVKFERESYRPGTSFYGGVVGGIVALGQLASDPNRLKVTDAVRSVLEGRNQCTTVSAREAYNLVDTNKLKLRVLATTAQKRLPQLPDVPTLIELGIDVQISDGYGFAMPAGVPSEAAAVMEAAMEKAHKSKAWQEFSHKNVFEGRWMGGAQFAAYLAQRLAELQEFQKATGN